MATDVSTSDEHQEQPGPSFYAIINYEDAYVQPLILSALEKRVPPSSYRFIQSLSELPSRSSNLLQFTQYESIDFEHLLSHPSTSLANAYVIRKALIRKHYLARTVSTWITKYPDTELKMHVKPSVDFEVDYAEFLDDALVEAWELKESWARGINENGAEKPPKGREWWILKPGMSERGQGIRLFSSEEELTAIFEEWDPLSDDGEEEDTRSDEGAETYGQTGKSGGDGIITSQLRHFIAQPYIHPPLLLSPTASPELSTFRKFHIRTYILVVGSLKVYVYKPMLALFAARPYVAPWESSNDADALKAHLTNTCLQDTNEREGSVSSFWDLPSNLPTQQSCMPNPNANWKHDIFGQICSTTADVFHAAARSNSIHFQALPNAFELFGLDFLVGVEEGGELTAYLLEVNAFPDFRQTGDGFRGLVAGLFECVVEEGVKPFFGLGGGDETIDREDGARLVKVLDVELGRKG